MSATASMICILTLMGAIAEVETGNNDQLIGASGERSKYQISEAAWIETTELQPFALCYGKSAEDAAYTILAKIVARIDSQDPAEIASAWNQGVSGHRSRGINDYAIRVSNLYHAQIPKPKRLPK